MRRPPLACTVRACGQPLERLDGVLACPAGHSFDVARGGYVNLLQPHDRRSLVSGDSKASLDARTALVSAGIGRALIDAVVTRAAVAVAARRDVVVAELGSGGGDTLAAMAGALAATAIGIDLSSAAASLAARRFPSLTWIVANADRRLPLVDHSVDLVLSQFGRRNPAECARVLAARGVMLVAVPAPDDLLELRAQVHGEGIARDRGDAVVADHREHFTLVERMTVREHAHLDRPALLNLLAASYRGARLATAAHVASLDRLDVTLSAELFVLARRPTGTADGV